MNPRADNLLTSFRRTHAFSGPRGVRGFAVHFYGNSKRIFFQSCTQQMHYPLTTFLHWKQSILVMNQTVNCHNFLFSQHRSDSPRNSFPVVRAIGHCGTGRNEISRFWPRYRLLMQLVGTTGRLLGPPRLGAPNKCSSVDTNYKKIWLGEAEILEIVRVS